MVSQCYAIHSHRCPSPRMPLHIQRSHCTGTPRSDIHLGYTSYRIQRMKFPCGNRRKARQDLQVNNKHVRSKMNDTYCWIVARPSPRYKITNKICNVTSAWTSTRLHFKRFQVTRNCLTKCGNCQRSNSLFKQTKYNPKINFTLSNIVFVQQWQGHLTFSPKNEKHHFDDSKTMQFENKPS